MLTSTTARLAWLAGLVGLSVVVAGSTAHAQGPIVDSSLSGHQAVPLTSEAGRFERERQAPLPFLSVGPAPPTVPPGPRPTAEPAAEVSACPGETDPRKAAGDLCSGAVIVADDEERDRAGWTALPFATFTPETGLGAGAFGLVFYRLPGEETESRPSSIALDALVTTRLQAIVELMPEFYFDDERWNLWTKWDIRLFPNSFWGIGADTPDLEERYSSLSFHGRMWLRRELVDGLYVGLRADALSFDVTEVKSGGLFETQTILGERGGFTFGLALTLAYDTRDNMLEAHSGGYYETRIVRFDNAWGSEFEFSRIRVDLRQFFSPYPDHVIATQLYGVFNDGDVPFHQLAAFGGKKQMRGYFEGRFRDHNMIVAQLEYRFPLFWRFRGVAFAGIGDVMRRIDDFDFGSLEFAAGAGIRFRLNEQERLNLRFDLAINRRGNVAPYIHVSEAF